LSRDDATEIKEAADQQTLPVRYASTNPDDSDEENEQQDDSDI
jgi:hypothetical protein